MTQLPTSIEQYLQEAGFSATELLVLKRLLEGSAMTLRELAAKTGKSTGVLDQATKKLIEKGIVSKESVNDSLKYTISSLRAIQSWVEQDMIKRHTALKRKKENFDAFLATVQHQSDRPEIESYNGKDGVKKAFKKLLDMHKQEWLHFAPAIMREEDDPLEEFKVQVFRERRKNKVFLRAVTPDVPIGRRFQSRDAFEYRQSRFVPAEEFPVSFEQYIVGDTVACIDTVDMKASFITYPQLAESQRNLFEVMWNRARVESEGGEVVEVVQPVPSMKTRLISNARDCFLSKASVSSMIAIVLFAFVATAGAYKYTLEIMKDEIGQRLMSIASTAAPEISATDIKAITTSSDMHKVEYQRIFNSLNQIRDRNEDIQYVYILRQSETNAIDEFVADADSNHYLLDSDDPDAEEVIVPGTRYSNASEPISIEAYARPIAENDFVSDKWGTYMSAFAPIFNIAGEPEAIIGIDMNIEDVYKLTRSKFEPSLIFILILLSCLVVRLYVIMKSNKSSLT